VYHKSFNRPILTYDFAEKTERRGGGGGGGGGGDSGVRGQQPTARSPGAVSAGGGDGERGASGAPKPPGQPLFVSATCWRGDEPVLLAANSTGSIKVLQLVE
jgi:E3 ubiquitin-protein ligase RFWD2